MIPGIQYHSSVTEMSIKPRRHIVGLLREENAKILVTCTPQFNTRHLMLQLCHKLKVKYSYKTI